MDSGGGGAWGFMPTFARFIIVLSCEVVIVVLLHHRVRNAVFTKCLAVSSGSLCVVGMLRQKQRRLMNKMRNIINHLII